jgi:hypothetical protein
LTARRFRAFRRPNYESGRTEPDEHKRPKRHDAPSGLGFRGRVNGRDHQQRLREFLDLLRGLPAKSLDGRKQIPETVLGGARRLPQILNHAGMSFYLILETADSPGQIRFHRTDEARQLGLIAGHLAAVVALFEKLSAPVRIDYSPKIGCRFRFSDRALQDTDLVGNAERIALG